METLPGSESPVVPRKKRTAAKVAPDAPQAVAEMEAKPVDSDDRAVQVSAVAPGLEALLLSVDRPVPPARLAEALGLIAPGSTDDIADAPDDASLLKPRGKKAANSPAGIIAAAVEHLNAQYVTTSRSFRVEKLAGGYRIMTLPAFAPILAAYHGRRERQALSRAAIETLSIVAYKQPLTRATLEAIRGVACGEVLRSLTERRLITIVGRAEEVGRPILYGTTKQFLELFGLSSVKDLPSVDELRLRGIASEPD